MLDTVARKHSNWHITSLDNDGEVKNHSLYTSLIIGWASVESWDGL